MGGCVFRDRTKAAFSKTCQFPEDLANENQGLAGSLVEQDLFKQFVLGFLAGALPFRGDQGKYIEVASLGHSNRQSLGTPQNRMARVLWLELRKQAHKLMSGATGVLIGG